MIERNHSSISLSRQSELLSISRTGLYYTPVAAVSSNDQTVLDLLDVLYTKFPFYGTRRMSHELFKLGHSIGRKAIRRYFKILRVSAIYPLPKGTMANKAHKKYPYLL
ncbi:MAG: hypothetical protein ACRCY5_05045, partial [Phocaeicola sp.]